MISQSVEYALRAVVTVAQCGERPCTCQQISEVTRVPAPYLSKLMQVLVRGGLLKSQRGLHGGFVLIKDARELTIYDIVDAVEPIKRIRECPLGIQAHEPSLCALHRRLDKAIEAVETMFRETTVAEMLAQSGNVMPLCEHTKVFEIKTSQTDSRAKKKPDNKRK